MLSDTVSSNDESIHFSCEVLLGVSWSLSCQLSDIFSDRICRLQRYVISFSHNTI